MQTGRRGFLLGLPMLAAIGRMRLPTQNENELVFHPDVFSLVAPTFTLSPEYITVEKVEGRTVTLRRGQARKGRK